MSDPRLASLPKQEPAKEIKEESNEKTLQPNPSETISKEIVKEEPQEQEENESQFSEFSNPEENDAEETKVPESNRAKFQHNTAPISGNTLSGHKRPHSDLHEHEHGQMDNSTRAENVENNHYQEHPSKHRDEESISSRTELKNGCCKECMKAFSRNKKSCLCQVPKHHRRSQLPPSGCKFCNCHG